MSGSQSSGGAMQDINNLVYIPLNTVQYRFQDQSYSMTDDLDGIELRLKPEADSIDAAKGGDVGGVEHAPQRPGFYGDDHGRALGAVAADMVANAAISPLVGGIAIMNIVLATRLRRRGRSAFGGSTGARRLDIVRQFLTDRC